MARSGACGGRTRRRRHARRDRCHPHTNRQHRWSVASEGAPSCGMACSVRCTAPGPIRWFTLPGSPYLCAGVCCGPDGARMNAFRSTYATSTGGADDANACLGRAGAKTTAIAGPAAVFCASPLHRHTDLADAAPPGTEERHRRGRMRIGSVSHLMETSTNLVFTRQGQLRRFRRASRLALSRAGHGPANGVHRQQGDCVDHPARRGFPLPYATRRYRHGRRRANTQSSPFSVGLTNAQTRVEEPRPFGRGGRAERMARCAALGLSTRSVYWLVVITTCAQPLAPPSHTHVWAPLPLRTGCGTLLSC